MHYTFKPKGVCSKEINFDIEDGKIKNVEFTFGCAGNTKGISKLCENRDAKEVAELLGDIKCGFKNTSCPGELSKAIKKALEDGYES